MFLIAALLLQVATPVYVDPDDRVIQLAGELDDGADWYQGLYVKHNAMYQYYDLLAKDNTGGRARCVK